MVPYGQLGDSMDVLGFLIVLLLFVAVAAIGIAILSALK